MGKATLVTLTPGHQLGRSQQGNAIKCWIKGPGAGGGWILPAGSKALTEPKWRFTGCKGSFWQHEPAQCNPRVHPAHRCPSQQDGAHQTHTRPLSNQIISNIILLRGVETCWPGKQIVLSLYHPIASPERSQQVEQDPPHGFSGAAPAHPAPWLSFARGKGEKPE